MTTHIPDGDTRRIGRRAVIRRLGAATGTLALAGCLGDDESDDSGGTGESNETDTESDADDDENPDEDLETTPERIEIEDPPDAVYVPTHREAMRVLEPIEAGEYVLAPMLSYPHPFWVIAGDGSAEGDVERESPEEGRGVHMMFVLWDAATDTVLPVDEGVQLRIEREGEQIAGSPRRPWPMLSQEMGFHFGDNVPLPEDGTYTVEVTIPPLSTRTTGTLEGRLDERATATFEFVYDDAFRTEVIDGVEYFDEEVWGRRGALEPMEHDGGGGEDDDHESHHIPYSALPPVEEYPGTLLVDAGHDSDSDSDAGADAVETTRDLPRSGDAAFLATLLESDSRLADGDDGYLLVSPRTPYNRVPLADMSLRATIDRDGAERVDVGLEQTLDDEYGLHYGRSLSDATLEPGDAVTITIESPPQVARHRGYETAFLEMPPIELTVPAEGDDR